MDEAQFLKYLSPVVESLHCGHTQLLPSESTQLYNRRFGKYFPFDPLIIGRRAFLWRDVTDTARGSEILKINGTVVSSILQNIRYKASTEGFSTASKDYFLSRNFADLYAANYPQSDSFTIELKDFKTKEIRTQTLASARFHPREEIETGILEEIDSLQSVVLRIPSGLNDSIMQAFLQKVMPMLNEKRYTNLVIDLRDNEKFRDSFGSMIYSYVSSEPFTYLDRIEIGTGDSSILHQLYIDSRKFREAAPAFYASLNRTDTLVTVENHPILKQYAQNAATFNGNVYVLINGGSNSAAADFAKFVQMRKRGVVIGQESYAGFHGSCDAGTTSIKLPNSGIRVSLPLANYRVSGLQKPNFRLIPDYPVQYSINDIIENKDREMETCRDLIIANCCTAKSN
jgi:hypothetical protein